MSARAVIVYRDARVIAVDKPSGVPVHRGPGDRDALLQRIRDAVGERVYPVHRLDRSASGLVLFGADAEAAAALAREFSERRVDKRYGAVVRGWPPEAGDIDSPLRDEEDDVERAAHTRFRTVATCELPLPVGRWATARYALMEVSPTTGRTHQIRRHLAHLRHPIVGDVRHGDGAHNRLFRDEFASHRLLLWCTDLAIAHPDDGRRLELHAPAAREVVAVLRRLGLPTHGD